MSRRERGYERGDDPIDWSGFDTADEVPGPVAGSAALAVTSGVMVVAGMAALVWGAMGFTAELERFGQTGSLNDLNPLFVAVAGAVTLIPALFGFQTASRPVSFLAPALLGAVGLVLDAAIAVSRFPSGSSLPWLVGAALACAYLVCLARMRMTAPSRVAAAAARRRPTKDELWDEKNVWK